MSELQNGDYLIHVPSPHKYIYNEKTPVSNPQEEGLYVKRNANTGISTYGVYTATTDTEIVSGKTYYELLSDKTWSDWWTNCVLASFKEVWDGFNEYFDGEYLTIPLPTSINKENVTSLTNPYIRCYIHGLTNINKSISSTSDSSSQDFNAIRLPNNHGQQNSSHGIINGVEYPKYIAISKYFYYKSCDLYIRMTVKDSDITYGLFEIGDGLDINSIFIGPSLISTTVFDKTTSEPYDCVLMPGENSTDNSFFNIYINNAGYIDYKRYVIGGASKITPMNSYARIEKLLFKDYESNIYLYNSASYPSLNGEWNDVSILSSESYLENPWYENAFVLNSESYDTVICLQSWVGSNTIEIGARLCRKHGG